MRMLLISLLTAMPLTAAQAQAHPICSARPQSLAEMRGCYRPLLVFAPQPGDPRLAAQAKALDAGADDMMDRNVLLVPVASAALAKVPVTGAATGFEAPLDAPYALLPPQELAAARARFNVGPGSFKVLLLGEDGSVKLRSSTPVSVDRLNALIDSMPTRKREMQQPHSN